MTTFKAPPPSVPPCGPKKISRIQPLLSRAPPGTAAAADKLTSPLRGDWGQAGRLRSPTEAKMPSFYLKSKTSPDCPRGRKSLQDAALMAKDRKSGLIALTPNEGNATSLLIQCPQSPSIHPFFHLIVWSGLPGCLTVPSVIHPS